MKNFRDLLVWEKAHALTLDIYRATKGFPKEEMYGLTAQIRESAVSVPSNIAEGCGRLSDADFRRFLGFSSGSAAELDYQLLLSHDLSYLAPEDYQNFQPRVTEVKKMVTSLIGKLG